MAAVGQEMLLVEPTGSKTAGLQRVNTLSWTLMKTERWVGERHYSNPLGCVAHVLGSPIGGLQEA